MVKLSKFKNKHSSIKKRYMENTISSKKLCLEYMSSLAQIYMDIDQHYEALALLILLLHLCDQAENLNMMKQRALDIAFNENNDPSIDF